MTVFSFTLEIESSDLMTDDAQNALFEAGCNDATFCVSDGVHTAEFDREATEFAEAVASAIKAVEAAVPGARVVEIIATATFADVDPPVRTPSGLPERGARA